MNESRDQAERFRAEPRWFGVPPPLLLLGLTACVFVASVALLAVGHWPAGLVLLGLSALFASAFLEVARRLPDSTLSRVSVVAADGARSRTRTSFELFRVRSRAVAQTQLTRAEEAVVESERRAVRLRLSEAIESGDDEDAAALRERLELLDRREEILRELLRERRAQTDERIRRIRVASSPTLVVHPDGEDSRRPAA